MKNQVYEIVTNRIIEQMEKGIVPWHQGWVGKNTCVSHSSGKQYSIINQMLLGEAGEYITFKQVQAEGGKVKKGAESKVVVFWKMLETVEKNDKDEEVIKKIPLLRYYRVFNIDDCEGIEHKYTRLNENFNSIEKADEIIDTYMEREGIGAEEADYAAYSPLEDVIKMPTKEQFKKEAEYYSTYFHEMIHSTGAKTRLNRLEDTAYFGSESYSKEELVAEIGSAFMMNNLKIEGGFDNSVAYIKGWAKRLAEDPKLIVSAAGKAEKAVEFIEGAK